MCDAMACDRTALAGVQVTTVLAEADAALAKIDEEAGEGAGGTAWLAEAQETADGVKAAQAAEVAQADKIRTLKEEMKGLEGDAKSAVNKQVQLEVNALKKLKQATADAQERCASAAAISRHCCFCCCCCRCTYTHANVPVFVCPCNRGCGGAAACTAVHIRPAADR